jgi:hypothetical protein
MPVSPSLRQATGDMLWSMLAPVLGGARVDDCWEATADALLAGPLARLVDVLDKAQAWRNARIAVSNHVKAHGYPKVLVIIPQALSDAEVWTEGDLWAAVAAVEGDSK